MAKEKVFQNLENMNVDTRFLEHPVYSIIFNYTSCMLSRFTSSSCPEADNKVGLVEVPRGSKTMSVTCCVGLQNFNRSSLDLPALNGSQFITVISGT